MQHEDRIQSRPSDLNLSVRHYVQNYFSVLHHIIISSYLSLNQSWDAASTCGFNQVVALGIALDAA